MDCLPSALPSGLLRECISLHGVQIPPTVAEIGPDLFRGCAALEQVELPDSVTRLGARAFLDCEELAGVSLGNGLKRIGARAFARCPALAEMEIPPSLRFLGFGAFGLGYSKERMVLTVKTEYLEKRLRRLVFWAGSAGRVEIRFSGKTIDQRKRERRRATVEQTATHIS